jgi:hypothetical protein
MDLYHSCMKKIGWIHKKNVLWWKIMKMVCKKCGYYVRRGVFHLSLFFLLLYFPFKMRVLCYSLM